MRKRCLALLWLLLAAAAPAAETCPASASERIEVRGAALCVFMDAAELKRQRATLHAWVERSADIVARFYGRFPAPLVLIKLHSMDGAGVGGGRTTNDPLVIAMRVGLDTSAEQLTDDWVMVHEMIHLALPELGRSHNWLAEGLSTYVEGVARAQAGNRAVSDVWDEDRRAMPAGLPRSGEGGMDQTQSWGRTYWGGALFCLLADIAIRRETHDRAGLQTALRAILRETGGYQSERNIDEVLALGDAATGTHVLQAQYARMKSTPFMTDLSDLWKQLGVPEDPKTQAFDDHAPLAAIRLSITRPPPERP